MTPFDQNKIGEFYECFDGESTFMKSIKELYETGNLIVDKNYSMEFYVKK